jgi:hypothetical protein
MCVLSLFHVMKDMIRVQLTADQGDAMSHQWLAAWHEAGSDFVLPSKESGPEAV